jgi:hypothetical protein
MGDGSAGGEHVTQPEPEDVVPAPRSAVLCAPWASPADIPEKYRHDQSNEEWQRYLMMASEILWMLSGRRFYGGGCEETVTLRSVPPAPGTGTWPYQPSWGSCACWGYGSWDHGWLYPFTGPWEREHYSPIAIKLPRAPIAAVTEVTVNGEPFAAWRLTRSGYLERTDGRSWAMCDDSTSVTYEFGVAPPEGGVQAAVEMAVQFALADQGSDDCSLPQRVTSVSRQGISIEVLDPQDFLEKGRVGLYLTDLWLASVNPKNRAQGGRVWSPDIPVANG